MKLIVYDHNIHFGKGTALWSKNMPVVEHLCGQNALYVQICEHMSIGNKIAQQTMSFNKYIQVK